MTDLSWLTGHLSTELLDSATIEARRRLVYHSLGIDREPEIENDVEFAAQSLQLLLYDALEQARTDRGTRDLCGQIFNLLRAQMPVGVDLAERKAVLRTCSIGWLADQGPLAAKLLGSYNIPVDVPETASWSERVTSCLTDVWLLLLRKDGWRDIDSLSSLIVSLREQQSEFERSYLERQGSAAHPAAWELVSLYHLARAAEITANYLTEGQSDNRFDVRQQVESHFDRAITASNMSGAVEVYDLAFILSFVSQQLLDNSLWSVARGAGPATTRFVEQLVSRARERPLFEVLPPQRGALNESGLARAAQRSVVVSLPTSSGKTLIAQFRILQALSIFDEVRGWVAYVAPTKALVNQVTSRLRRDFSELGIVVERVGPALEIDSLESGILKDEDPRSQFRVLVTTPEKLDLLLRGGWQEDVGRPLCLIVVDEAHNLSSENRGLKLELLLATINRESRDAQFLLLTPFIRNAGEIARWLDPVSSQEFSQGLDWRPNDRIIALAHRNHGSKRGDYNISLETIATTRDTLFIEDEIPIGANRPSGYSWSTVNSANKLAAATALLVEERGGTITLTQRPDYAWLVAQEIQNHRPSGYAADSDVGTVQRIIGAELGSNFPLVDLLDKGIGVHHSGLSDEVRILTEWLFEQNKISHLVSTTTVAQGVNFPVANVVFATHQYPYGEVMPPSDFWNIAGRAGRVDQGQVGLVALACPDDERANVLRSFIGTSVSALNSTLVGMVQEAIRSMGRLDLRALSYKPEWSSFLQFLAHTYRQIGNHEEFAAEIEQVLRGTLGFQALRTTNSSWANSLIVSVREYAEGLSGHPLSLVDSTGFSWESVSATLGRLSGTRISANSWEPEIFDSGNTTLQSMIGIMLQVPELRESLTEVSPQSGDNGEFLARVVQDWVNGMSVPDLAQTYFQNEKNDTLAAITKCSSRLFSKIAPTVAWGLSALQSLTLGSAREVTEADMAHLRNLPAYAFYGVRSDDAIALRMLGVPRAAATPLARRLVSQPSSAQPGAQQTQLKDIRQRLRQSRLDDWVQTLGPRGEDYFRAWRIIEGSI